MSYEHDGFKFLNFFLIRKTEIRLQKLANFGILIFVLWNSNPHSQKFQILKIR